MDTKYHNYTNFRYKRDIEISEIMQDLRPILSLDYSDDKLYNYAVLLYDMGYRKVE